MAVDKTKIASTTNLTGSLGIAGKTVTSVFTYRLGNAEVTDIYCTDGAHYFIKSSQGQVETGGTAEWGTGTKIGGR